MRDYSGVSGGIYVAYLKLRYLLTYKAWHWWHVKHEFCSSRENEYGEWRRRRWAVTVCDFLEDYRTGWRGVEAILDELEGPPWIDAVEEMVDLGGGWKFSGQPVEGFREAMNAEVES
tara:strand:+ start:1283 stop:1633 length:351 start_codon:yes stop_codon:yes gene_type:complete